MSFKKKNEWGEKMKLEQLEVTIKDLKSKINPQEGEDAVAARKTKKRLKRAQRRRRAIIKKTTDLSARTKKKEEAVS